METTLHSPKKKLVQKTTINFICLFISFQPLIILSVIFTATPLLVLGSAILIQERGGVMPPWLPVLCIGVCLFASGQHMPLPFIVMSEMFSIEVIIIFYPLFVL